MTRARHNYRQAPAADPDPDPWRCWTGCPVSSPACRFHALCRPGAQPPPKEPAK